MKLLQEIILDFQEQALECGVTRRLPYEIVAGKVFVCVGVRRCGKSTLLFQIVDRLQRQGVGRKNILYVNLFDDRLDTVRRGGMRDVVEAYYALYPQKRRSEKVYCFFDEIQMVSGWESFVDRLLRTEKCEVFIMGSSSRMLSREIATQMRGRAIAWELFPFSFAEYLRLRGAEAKPLSSKSRVRIQKCFAEYWERGGFPEVRDASARVRLMTHQEYFKTMVHRDVVERNDAAHPQAVLDAALRLINQVGSMFSINALTGYLKSLGHKATKTFVGECIKWFEDAYFLFPVKIFHPSVSVQNANARKVYCVDHGMVGSVSNGILVNSGHLLENLVFSHLRAMTDRIHYYRTGNGKEVDFIWSVDGRQWRLTQVCESLAAEKTRRRELGAVREAMEEKGLNGATVVTRDETETVDSGEGRIDVVPAWRYLMDLDRTAGAS